jgi:hypothetical protein
MKQSTGIDVAAALRPALERGVKVGQADLGEEAQCAQVDAENRNFGTGKNARRGTTRASRV